MRELLMLVGQGTFLPVLHGVTRKEAIDQFVNSPQAAKHEPSEWTSLVLTFKHTTSISVGAGSQALERQFVEQIVHSTVRLCVTSVSTQIRGHALNSIWAGRFIKKLEAAAREMSKTFDYIPRSAAKDAQAWADEMKSFTKGSSRSPDGGAHPTSSSDTSVLRVGEPVPAGTWTVTYITWTICMY